ncbi:hypothetical protein KL86PLE_100282 [uncultured Pleomorphomonas sp.]|uniref:Uncharacterized protein n=1 Tax=uncultured Pleomorphomonas sp. TaxID=442121 RepID=A0A212L211_9HYPH|nr:hypothetical protein [uncultured Pleomorphomonas sp.]SCM71604.1 hypothetical protein KL86PLE_100282 [uncultured Pleomorphomonas sp.]
MADRIEVTAALMTEIEAKAKAATGGPWAADGCYVDSPNSCLIYDEGGHDEDDARHIARMDPPTTLALIAHIRALEAENADPNTGELEALQRVAAAAASARLKALKEAEALIAQHSVQHTSTGPVLIKRFDGDREGLVYAAAIRALAEKEQLK